MNIKSSRRVDFKYYTIIKTLVFCLKVSIKHGQRIRYVGAYECKYYITPVACVANDPFFKYSTFGHNTNSYVFLNQNKNIWHPKIVKPQQILFSTSKGISFQPLKGWTHRP